MSREDSTPGGSADGITIEPVEHGNLENLISTSLGAMQATLLSQVEKIVSEKMGDFQKQVSAKQEDLAEEQLVKLREMQGTEHKFKRKGNELQFKFNKQVRSKFEAVNTQLSRDTVSSEQIKQAAASISEGMSIIDERQKLILLADTSELGWRVVEEYKSPDLAQDSDDEKKIRRATFQAERKAKATTKKKSVGRYTPYNMNARYGNPWQQSHAAQSPSTSFGPNVGVSSQYFRPKPGSCFLCGAVGHWARDCSMKGNAAAGLQPKNQLSDSCLNSVLCENFISMPIRLKIV